MIFLQGYVADPKPPMARIGGLPNLFGVCVYSFMCHHSLPSLGEFFLYHVTHLDSF